MRKIDKIKLIEELLQLKKIEIQNKNFKNFWGNSEEIQQRREKVEKEIERFTKKVKQAFPDIL